MGYGKTTAINWYLENEKASLDATVMRISIYSDNLMMFWRQFQKAFSSTDIADSILKTDFPDTRAGLYFFMEMISDYLNENKKIHYIFIDDYHLLMHPSVTRFIIELAEHAPDNLRTIVASRNVFVPHRSVIELGNRLYMITKNDLSLNHTEILSYCHLCGVTLDAPELEALYALSEGWFSGICLCLRSYAQNGSMPLSCESIYDMMDEVLLSDSEESEMEFLLSLCLADEISEDMAVFLSGRKDAPALLSNAISRNSFITRLPDNRAYRLHHILKECVRRTFNKLSDIKKKTYYIKYANWYEDHELYAKAIEMYRDAGEWSGLLRVIRKDQAMELSYFTKDEVEAWVNSCPVETLKKDPYAILVLMRRYFSWRLVPQMYELKSIFIDAVTSSDTFEAEEKNNLLGECELVMSFTAYNDIEKMSEFHRRACELMNRPAMTMSNRGTWTFGSPSVLAMFHKKAGCLDAENDAMHSCMPYYYRLTDDHGMGAEYMMEAETCVLRGEMNQAKIALRQGQLRAEAATGRQKEMRFILLCGLFINLEMSLVGATKQLQDWYENELSIISEFRSPMLITTLDLCAAWYFSLIGETLKIPEWISNGELEEANLLFPAKPVAEIIYNQVLYAMGRYDDICAREEKVSGLCSLFPYVYCQLYLELQLAASFVHLDMPDKAEQHVKKALETATPDRLIIPFAFFDELLPYLDKKTKEDVSEWSLRYNEVRENNKMMITIPEALNELTGQELRVALLMTDGKKNKDISRTLFLSEGTIKQYINRIYGKLGLTGTPAEKREKLIMMVSRS